MAIKFQCPHCTLTLTVKDQLAGRKGNCPKCKNPITVPGGAAPVARGPKPGPVENGEDTSGAPPAPPADVEAAAAALLGDEPKEGPGELIEMECPFCFEEIQLPASAAGLREPCPLCKQIIRVPEPEKKGTQDWKKASHIPSGARVTEAEPEGAWGTGQKSAAHKESLEEAGVLPPRRPPRTTGQKVTLVALPAVALLLLCLGGWTAWSWWRSGQREQAVAEALAYADSPEAKDLTPAMRAYLHLGASEFYRQAGDDVKGRAQLGQALAPLLGNRARGTDERDTALLDLLPALVDLGGRGLPEENPDRKGRAATQKSIQGVMLAVQHPRAREANFRALARALLKAGEARRVVALAGILFADPTNPDHADARALTALLLLEAGRQTEGLDLGNPILHAYAQKNPPALRPHVVAFALATDRTPPEPGKGLAEQEAGQVGRVIGLAYRQQWQAARDEAAKASTPKVRLRALVGLGEAALAREAGTEDVQAALTLLGEELQSNLSPREAWFALHAVALGLRAGLSADQLLPGAQAIPAEVAGVRGRADLLVFRARLASADGVVAESHLKEVAADTGAHARARLELARHNVRADAGWADTARAWEPPFAAFGSLGAALGQEGD